VHSVTVEIVISGLTRDTGCGCRELEEECGLKAKLLRQVGLLMFEFIGEPQLLEVHVFTASEYDGTVVETEGQC